MVDICPVGALTSTDFRFRGRVWFMSAAASVCTGCARGCNTFLDYLNDVTYRYRPRENEAVNQEWMCDQGRASYKYLNADRVLAAREGRGAKARALAVGAAAREAAAALAPHARAGTLAVLLSPVASLEDLLVACAVAKDGLSATQVYVGGRADGWQDDFLKRADENPNRKGLELAAAAYGLAVRPFAELGAAVAAGKVKAIWAVGTELPDAGAAERLGAVEVLVAQSHNDHPARRVREPAPAGGAALGGGRHLRELRGAGAAVRDGLLPARRGPPALGAGGGDRRRARPRPAGRERPRRLPRARAEARGRAGRLRRGTACRPSASASASCRWPPAPWTGGSRATATACRPRPPRTTGARSRARRRRDGR